MQNGHNKELASYKRMLIGSLESKIDNQQEVIKRMEERDLDKNHSWIKTFELETRIEVLKEILRQIKGQ